jgi:hypothetical protein
MINLASTVILMPLNAALVRLERFLLFAVVDFFLLPPVQIVNFFNTTVQVTTEASMKRVNAYPARIKTALTALIPMINATSAKDRLEEQRLAAAENAFPPIAIHAKLTIPSAVSATLDMVRTLKENVLLVAQSSAKIVAPTRVNADFANPVLAETIASLAPLVAQCASLLTSATNVPMDTRSILVTHAQRTSKFLLKKKRAPRPSHR